MTTNPTQKRLWIGILCALAGLMLLFNILTPMVCDDYRYCFSFATGERMSSLWQIFPSLVKHGQVLNARYAPHFFVQLFDLLPLIVFDAVNTGMFLLLLVGICRLAAPGCRFDPALLAGVFGALFLLPPAFGQNMLWLAGACNYLWPATLLVWLLGPFFRQVSGGEQALSPLGIALMALGGLLFGNSSENLSAAGMLVMGLCILWQLLNRRKAPLWMWLTVAMALCGWLLLMLSPVDKPTGMAQEGLLGQLMDRFTGMLQKWMTHVGWLLAITVVLGCLAPAKENREKLALAAMLTLASLCCQLAMILPSYTPDRVLLGPIVLQLCACALLWPVLGEGQLRRLGNGLCACALIFALLTAAGALPQNYNRFRLAKARDALMVEAARAGETDVTTFYILGRSKYDAFDGLIELSSDIENFANVAYADYFGLNTVVVDRLEE